MTALIRRPVLGAFLVAAALASVAAAGADRTWKFKVSLNDAEIGYHHFTLHEDGSSRELTTEARFTVKVLGISAYRYAHDAKEHWRAACLDRLTAHTDDDGERIAVSAEPDGNGLAVTNARGRTVIDGCVMTFAYWNPAILKQKRLLNAQTGEYEAVTIADLGTDTLTVRGAEIRAKHYRITGSKHPIDLWYSPQNEWLALESTVAGGRRLRYRL